MNHKYQCVPLPPPHPTPLPETIGILPSFGTDGYDALLKAGNWQKRSWLAFSVKGIGWHRLGRLVRRGRKEKWC